VRVILRKLRIPIEEVVCYAEIQPPMRTWFRTSPIALLAILGVCLVFLFPAACGPFSVTHGPATAFRALAAACALFAAMASVALLAVLRCMFYLQRIARAAGPVHFLSSPLSLRC
jgi:hypothetical protein